MAYAKHTLPERLLIALYDIMSANMHVDQVLQAVWMAI